MKHTIKNPTVRKVINRGFTPVTYHCQRGFVSGWIYARGHKWLRFYSPSTGTMKIAIAEECHMTKHQ